MRSLCIAAASLLALMIFYPNAPTAVAAPLALADPTPPSALAPDNLVENIHGSHCATRYSRRLGWHRHWRACRRHWRWYHDYRPGCWMDGFGYWHCMYHRYHRHPRGCRIGPDGITCWF